MSREVIRSCVFEADSAPAFFIETSLGNVDCPLDKIMPVSGFDRNGSRVSIHSQSPTATLRVRSKSRLPPARRTSTPHLQSCTRHIIAPVRDRQAAHPTFPSAD
jgi:hypothetical protein